MSVMDNPADKLAYDSTASFMVKGLLDRLLGMMDPTELGRMPSAIMTDREQRSIGCVLAIDSYMDNPPNNFDIPRTAMESRNCYREIRNTQVITISAYTTLNDVVDSNKVLRCHFKVDEIQVHSNGSGNRPIRSYSISPLGWSSNHRIDRYVKTEVISTPKFLDYLTEAVARWISHKL